MPTDKAFHILIALLRLGLGNSSAAPAPISPDVWRAVYHMAAKHAVIALAWKGVERLQAQAPEVLQSLPPDLMGKWFADVQAIESANRRLANQTRQILDRLSADGYRAHLLKGASMAAYYPVPEHRQAADIDLWVLPATNGERYSLRAHRQALMYYLRRQPDISIGEIVYHHIETTFHDTEVEFHVTPTWFYNPVHNSRLQQIFAQTGQLTPELQELYTLLHAFRHIYHDGLALRHMLDYRLVSQANRAVGILSPDDLYQQLGLQPFANAVNELADKLFGQNDASLSRRARHLLNALPARKISAAVRWDYPSETLCVLPWRAVHFLWRKQLSKAKII